MSYCPNCHKNLTFSDVLKSVNPVKIKCRGCGKSTSIHPAYAVITVILTSIVTIGIVVLGLQAGLNGWLLLIILIAFGFAAEFIYYALIKNGTIKSGFVSAKSL